MKWTEAYEHAGQTIPVPVKLIHALGAKGAILVSRLYWEQRKDSGDGWILKTQIELEEETGLTRHEQNTCVEDLKKLKILETRYERLEHRLFYHILIEGLNTIMEVDSPSEIRKADFPKSEPDVASPKSGFPEIRKADLAREIPRIRTGKGVILIAEKETGKSAQDVEAPPSLSGSPVSSSLHPPPFSSPNFLSPGEEKKEKIKKRKKKPSLEECQDYVRNADLVLRSDSRFPEFIACWRDIWIPARYQHRSGSPTEIALKLQLDKCAQWGAAKSIRAMRNSAEKGYQGFVPDPADNRGGQNGSSNVPNPTPEPKRYVTYKPSPEPKEHFHGFVQGLKELENRAKGGLSS